MLISLMDEESRLGLSLGKHQAMKDNLLKGRNMGRADTSVEMSGSMKGISLIIRSQVQRER